jgi:hypothetical protein
MPPLQEYIRLPISNNRAGENNVIDNDDDDDDDEDTMTTTTTNTTTTTTTTVSNSQDSDSTSDDTRSFSEGEDENSATVHPLLSFPEYYTTAKYFEKNIAVMLKTHYYFSEKWIDPLQCLKMTCILFTMEEIEAYREAYRRFISSSTNNDQNTYFIDYLSLELQTLICTVTERDEIINID